MIFKMSDWCTKVLANVLYHNFLHNCTSHYCNKAIIEQLYVIPLHDTPFRSHILHTEGKLNRKKNFFPYFEKGT